MMALRLSKLRGILPLRGFRCDLYTNSTELIWGHTFASKAEIQDVDYTAVDAVPKEPKKGSGTYDEIKEAARRSGGDPAREWMQGSSAKGSTVYKAAKADNDQLYKGTKRSVEEGTTRHELLRDVRYSSEEGQALKDALKQENSGVTAKIKDKMHAAADTVENRMENMKSKFGSAVSSLTENEEIKGEQAINARAVWEETRSEEQKKAENAIRKSQLTDEALRGDNTKEKIPRMEKQTIPDPLDTPH